MLAYQAPLVIIQQKAYDRSSRRPRPFGLSVPVSAATLGHVCVVELAFSHAIDWDIVNSVTARVHDPPSAEKSLTDSASLSHP